MRLIIYSLVALCARRLRVLEAHTALWKQLRVIHNHGVAAMQQPWHQNISLAETRLRCWDSRESENPLAMLPVPSAASKHHAAASSTPVILIRKICLRLKGRLMASADCCRTLPPCVLQHCARLNNVSVCYGNEATRHSLLCCNFCPPITTSLSCANITNEIFYYVTEDHYLKGVNHRRRGVGRVNLCWHDHTNIIVSFWRQWWKITTFIETVLKLQ